MSEITDKQVEALIAMALKPDLGEELTDAEIDQFIKEYDEGKHPLSDKDKDALATSGFRQYLRASFELDKVRAQLKAQAEQIAAKEALEQLRKDKERLDWLLGNRKCSTTLSGQGTEWITTREQVDRLHPTSKEQP